MATDRFYVDPAPAGMARTPPSSATLAASGPRARGDGPCPSGPVARVVAYGDGPIATMSGGRKFRSPGFKCI